MCFCFAMLSSTRIVQRTDQAAWINNPKRFIPLTILFRIINAALLAAFGVRGGEVIPDYSPNGVHFTLWEFKLNITHPFWRSNSFGAFQEAFNKALADAYRKFLTRVTFLNENGHYSIMGQNGWLCRNYDLSPKDMRAISAFRTGMYMWLGDYFAGKKANMQQGPSTMEVMDNRGTVYLIYKVDGKEMLAVPQYVHGRTALKPHVSLFTMAMVQKGNPDLWNYLQSISDKEKIATFVKLFHNRGLASGDVKVQYPNMMLTDISISKDTVPVVSWGTRANCVEYQLC